MKVRNQQIYSFDNFQLDAGNRQLRRGDIPLSLSAKAFDVLIALVENNGRLVTKDEIFANVWRDQIVEESNLTVHISQVRKALGENKNNPRYIETIPGYGYRFAGKVSNLEDEELVIETETLSRITIEKEQISGAGIAEGEKTSPLLDVPAPPLLPVSAYQVLALGGFFVLLVSAFGFYYFNGAKPNPPFGKMKFARLTNSGQVSLATLSTDGKFVAYVLSESEGNSLWVRQVDAANDTRIVPPVKAEFWGLTFTPDGTHIYYNLFTSDKTDLEIFRIPSLGGVSEKIPNVIASYLSVSPDGKRIAYAQSDSPAGRNHLVVADADGKNQQVIASKDQPNTFEANAAVVSWSRDGETIACLVNHFEPDASYSSIIGINVRDGSETLLSEQRWYDLLSLEWLKDGSGLLVSGSDKMTGGSQIWFIS
ncbi:MAG: winged helix-turn-helix domain-containing protein, partial [Acidobacteriota bacterium]